MPTADGGRTARRWLSVELTNVGLGPALRVEVGATYDDPEAIAQITPRIWPTIMPGQMAQLALSVAFETEPSSVNADGFPLTGTYLDRSQDRRYDIITSWRTSG